MFYLITVQNGDTPSMLGYDSYDAALAAFHTELAYRHESRTSTRCMIIDSELKGYISDSYIKEVTSEPEQEG